MGGDPQGLFRRVTDRVAGERNLHGAGAPRHRRNGIRHAQHQSRDRIAQCREVCGVAGRSSADLRLRRALEERGVGCAAARPEGQARCCRPSDHDLGAPEDQRGGHGRHREDARRQE